MPRSTWFAPAGALAEQVKIGDLVMYGGEQFAVRSIAEEDGRLAFTFDDGTVVRRGRFYWFHSVRMRRDTRGA